MNPASGPKANPRQAPSPGKKPSRWPWLLALLAAAAALMLILALWAPAPQGPGRTQTGADRGQGGKTTAGPSASIPLPPEPGAGGKVVNLAPSTASDSRAGQEQARRKKPYGLDKSLDAVVRSDESIKVGDRTISVAELERKLVVGQRGEILDRPLKGKGKVSAWGVHLVRPGENLWDIHYALLREYLAGRGVHLPPGADQPNAKGRSSGVGKILKFAEHMVGVYNIKTGRMSSNLNLLEPGRKVVIFNLSEIFDQLAKINPRDLSGVMYDGRVLLFPEPVKGDAAGAPPASPK